MLSNGIHIGRRGGVRLTGGGGEEGWPAALRNSLVAFWPLNETSNGSGAVSRADLVGTNTLTDNNTVTSATGLVYNNSANFVAANSEQLIIASNAALQMGDVDFWLATWAMITTNGALRFLMAKADGGGTPREYQLAYSDSAEKIAFAVGHPTEVATIENVFSTETVTLNQWFLAVAWYASAAKTVNISFDGGAAASAAVGFTPAVNATSFRLGYFGSGDNTFHQGRMGPAMLGKGYIPTVADVTWLYNSGAGRAY